MQTATGPSAHRAARRAARRLALVTLLATVPLAVSGCSFDGGNVTADTGSGTRPPVATDNAAGAIEHLEPKAFAERLSQPGVVVLDVRTPTEYADGHIPKAQNIDVQASDFARRLAALDKSAGYAIYCRSGVRSNSAGQQMLAAGFGKVADLEGGIAAWTKAGNPVVRS